MEMAGNAYICGLNRNDDMADTPLFSIITITYNAESVLAPTMRSVKEQTFSDCEHLVIDGASRDGTLTVARKAGRRDVRIVSEPDKGLYDAMNKGLKGARGKYVLFLNAGDTFHDRETLSLYASAAERDADIIYGDTVLVDSSRRIVGKRHLSAPEELTYESFSHGMLICHQAFMVRRDIAPQYDTHYRFSADYDWTIRCISLSRPERRVNLHAVVADYLTEGLTDKNMWKSLRERFDVMRRHYGLVPTALRHVGFAFRFMKRGGTIK